MMRIRGSFYYMCGYFFLATRPRLTALAASFSVRAAEFSNTPESDSMCERMNHWKS